MFLSLAFLVPSELFSTLDSCENVRSALKPNGIAISKGIYLYIYFEIFLYHSNLLCKNIESYQLQLLTNVFYKILFFLSEFFFLVLAFIVSSFWSDLDNIHKLFKHEETLYPVVCLAYSCVPTCPNGQATFVLRSLNGVSPNFGVN